MEPVENATAGPELGPARRFLRRAALYGAVGVVNTLVGFSVITVLDLALRLHSHLANALGYAAGLVTSFVLNRLMVFQSREKAASSGPRFLVSAAAAFGLNQLVLTATLTTLGREPLGRLIAQGLSMASYTLAFFLLCQFWVFAHRPSAATR